MDILKSKTQDIILYRIKEAYKKINPHLLSILITNTLTQLFDYSNKITSERIKDIEIVI